MFARVEPGNCKNIRVTDVNMEVFGFDRPVIRERGFEAAANRPPAHVLCPVRNSALRLLYPAKCSTAGQIGKKTIECIADAAPDRSQPWPLFCARHRIASGGIVSLCIRPRKVAFDAEYEISNLPIISSGEA